MTANQKPPRKTGFSHLLAATGYSAMGFRRALKESAFRQELLGGALGFAVLLALQVGAARLVGFAVLFLLLLAIEALNTAIEVLVDHLSPQWSQFAKDAKDLGSFAVGSTILALLVYMVWAIFL